MSKDRIIVLFREDLRLHDHPALYEATKTGEVIPLYIFDDHNALGGVGEAKKMVDPSIPSYTKKRPNQYGWYVVF